MKTFLQKHLDDALILGGCVVIVAAAAQWNTGVAMLTAGVEMIVIGVLIGIGGRSK